MSVAIVNILSDGTDVCKLDPYLEPFAPALRHRYSRYQKWKADISASEASLDAFSKSYTHRGLHRQPDNSVTYTEYAPAASRACLIGEFNDWQLWANEMARNDFGVWECTVPARKNGSLGIPHGSKVKLSMVTAQGERIDRLPAYIRRATQDLSVSSLYDAVFWSPPEAYIWKHQCPVEPKQSRGGLKIYEAHVGISTPEGRVGTYNEFRVNILPRIKALGYTAIQLMAIQEHAYYASFGYQVTSFFAVSSRYGTPEELKHLVDDAHGLGLAVLLDLVHSHACKNVLDGLNMFDGTDHCYFHGGGKGQHELWDSRLFNYSSWETLRFLLSNVRFYLDEYRFDGFRFDGVTSMMYNHHGIGRGFSGGYHEYFGDDVDLDAIVYLMLANDLIHSVRPSAISIAEDVSGMPTLCRPVSEGGVGFDYRLAMAIPDMWIKMLKEQPDQDWNMGNIVFTLINRRHMEQTIAYAESHDQALVGDKTLAFWLMDAEMYTNMSDLTALTPIIDRGIALHKLIRLLTHGLGGEGWLCFEGNEFGHPEWLDFPRAGNNNSFHHARRQWNLADDALLRYRYLNAWDAAMQAAESRYHWLSSPQAWVSMKHESDKVIVFERGDTGRLVWVFNLHPTQSYTDYNVGVNMMGQYRVVLDSDEARFGGHGRVDHSVKFTTHEEGWCGRRGYFRAYLPCRTAVVYRMEG